MIKQFISSEKSNILIGNYFFPCGWGRKALLTAGLLLSVGGWSQSVGIGTNTPTAKLHIEVPAGYTQPLLRIVTQGATAPHLIVLANGNVGIGVAAPAEMLDVAGNIQFAGALMPGGTAGAAGQVLISQGAGTPPQWQSAGPANGIAAICNSPGVNQVQKWTGSDLCNSIIYDDGTNVGIGTTSPTYKLHVNGRIKSIGINETSDQRLKKDIVVLDSKEALEHVLQLRAVYYRWIDTLIEQGYPASRQIGLIAQEVQKVVPEVVHKDNQGWYSVEYTRLVPVLIEAIKELKRENEALRQELELLKQHTNIAATGK